jgi:hypothetical protein
LRVRGLCVDRLAFTLLKYGYATDVTAWAYTYVNRRIIEGQTGSMYIA